MEAASDEATFIVGDDSHEPQESERETAPEKCDPDDQPEAVTFEGNEEDESFTEDLDLDQCAGALAEFFQIDTTPQMAELDEQIEDMLRHIQEFCGHLAKIQSDTSFALQHKIPEIHSRAVEMKEMYQQIDNLETFVAMISKNVADMEESVGNAEKLFGSNPLTRALKGFTKPSFLSGFGSKPKAAAAKPDMRWEAPEIFSTSDYLPTSPSESSAELPANVAEEA